MTIPIPFRAAMWAGLIALDSTGFGPLMVSQPLICGPLFGWLTGQLMAGVILGGIAQLLWMDVTPVGVGIPYDVTAVTILSVYWATLKPAVGAPELVLGMVLAAPMGYVFQALDKLSRRLNTLLARQVEAVPDDYLSLALTGGILGGLVWCWVRSTLCYGVVMILGQKVMGILENSPGMGWVNDHADVALMLLPIAGLGVVLELFLSEEPERRFQALKNRAKRN